MTALGPGDVAGRLGNLGVIPVATVTDAGQAEPLFEALCAGGLPVIEVTLRAPAATEVVRQLAEAHPDALIGAGTVLSVRDAATVMDFGAKFVVSPVTDPDVVRECAARGVPALPGACTPTEVHTAQLAGAELVKFFPAEALGGPRFLRALAGPLPSARLVPTGGIDASNLAEYLALPVVAACGGSWMVPTQALVAHRYTEVTRLVREAVAIVREARHGD